MNWKRIKDRISGLFTGFFGGMKIVGDEIFTQASSDDSKSITINQQVQKDRVSKDLLSGQETRQVQELRYRTYEVDRESKKYEVYSPYLASKEWVGEKNISVFNEENSNIKLIQINFSKVETVYEALEKVGKECDTKPERWIKIRRDSIHFIPRYKIEDYTEKLVVREIRGKETVLLDFYVTIYPNSEIPLSKGFIREVENVKNNGLRSEILVFDTVEFVTLNAYKSEDMFKYVFEFPRFRYVTEFDGYYVITFECQYKLKGKDLMEKYFSDTMYNKYKNKLPKEKSSNIEDYMKEDTFICDVCGKEVKFDPEKIDEMEYTEDPDDTRNLEYFDIQMIEQETGKKMCLDCYKKYFRNKNKELNDK